MSGQMKSMPGDVEADDPGRGLGDLDVVGVRLDRPVDRGPAGRHVAGQGELDPGPGGQDLVHRRSPGRATSASAASSTLIRVRTFSWPMPRRGIAVGDVDQLADGVLAVAGHRRRDALGDGRDLAADDQAAVVVAGDVRLDDDVARPALGQRAVERGPDGLLRAQVEVDAPAVVAVERLDHAREAEPLGRGHRAVLGVDDVGARDRQPGRVEQPVGQALVRRDVDADGRGQRGHRRPDPLLVDAVPELDERVAVEPDERDVAADRLVDERLGRRPERLPLGEPDEPLELGREVEEDLGVVRRDEVVDERDGHPAGLEPDRLLAVLVDAVVLAVPGRRRASCRGGRRCRPGSGTRARCARRRGPTQVPSRSRVMKPPRRPSEQAWSSSVGSSATSASVKPGSLFDGYSSRTPRSTSRRMTGSRAQ